MHKDSKLIKRNGYFSVSIALTFVIVYILIIAYTCNKVEVISHDTLLKSNMTSATSISTSINTDISYIKFIASELSNNPEKLTPEKGIQSLKAFLSSEKSTSLRVVGYSETDGDYYATDGRSGKLPTDILTKVLDGIKNNKKLVDVFNAKTKYTYICVPVFSGTECVGATVGFFDYSSIFTNSTPIEYFSEESTTLLVNADGTILSQSDENLKIFEGKDFFKYIKENASNSLFDRNGAVKESEDHQAFVIISGQKKYSVAFSKIDCDSDVYIATVVPSSALFSQSGTLIASITIASFLFFFAILTIAYKFYKSLKSSSEEIETIAYQDPLTGYPNFSKFKEDAKEILERYPNKQFYICCADMVGFRYINDAFGYDAGDQILVSITQTIDELLIDNEIFSRISGDKYIILTERNFSETDTNFFLYKLTDRISSIQPLAKSHIRLEVQMGIYAIQPEDIHNMSINAMYDRSLVALYSIEHVDSGVALYDAEIHNEQIEKKNIESKMHAALNNGEFRVYVQPKYRTANGKLAAGEALIRWVDPEKGLVPPIKFIPLFEQNRFVHDIDLYVMEVVSRFMRMRLNEGKDVVPISLNISPVELTMPGFRESYISIKEKYNIPDGLIELEFTEGIFFENEQYFREIITDFQAHGFTCSIDDFGSGYSSLNILKSLPVDTLKLDRLFFRESDDISRDRSVVRSVVAMARSLNIKTVAEGVETMDSVDFLKLIGCTLIQGYIYSKPLPLTEFEERLNTEEIDSDSEFEYDFDKFEAIPLDMPLSNSLDSSLRRTYAAICEINAGGNIYHMYYPGESNNKFDAIPERGFYSAFVGDFIPKYVHPDDVDRISELMNPINLNRHFEVNKELDFEYRHIRKDGAYSWMKIHIIKASGGRTDSQIFFAYFNIIDTYKETEKELDTFKNRFSSAYAKFNGVVFEFDIASGNMEMLESHANILNVFSGATPYETFEKFVIDNLLHPDYKEKLNAIGTPEYLSEYFSNPDNPPLTLQLMAKPSRKAIYYSYYEVSFAKQADSEKVLISIEDISAHKEQEAGDHLRQRVTETAFANVYNRVYHIILNKDFFSCAEYPPGCDGQGVVTEGKYSIFFNSTYKELTKEEDQQTMFDIFGLEALQKFYDDPDVSQTTISFQLRTAPGVDEYEWYESLIISVPLEFGLDKNIYIFQRCIEERKETEKMLNECAHRLSYSLAMFDYAYTVNTHTETVEIIGGLCFDTELMGAENMSYNDITMHVKNSEIAEDDRSAFRRFTYLDELKDYFSHNPATITKYFSCLDQPDKVVELSIIYGSREQSITIFIRKLNRPNLAVHAKAPTPTPITKEQLAEIESFNLSGQPGPAPTRDIFDTLSDEEEETDGFISPAPSSEPDEEDESATVVPNTLKSFLNDRLFGGSEKN